MPVEFFDHTADVGMRISAKSIDNLFEEAGVGLASLLVENVGLIQPLESDSFTLNATDRESLLVDWLNELLFLFETEKKLFIAFKAALKEGDLAVVAQGQTIDSEQIELRYDIKAVTYHRLKIQRMAEWWKAEVVFDI